MDTMHLYMGEHVTVTGWGSDWGARRASFVELALLRLAVDTINHGGEVYLHGCPEYRGQTVRRLVIVNNRIYTRAVQNGN